MLHYESPDRVAEPDWIEWFHDVSGCPLALSPKLVGLAAFAGDHDDWDVCGGLVLLQLATGAKTVEMRHDHVQKDEVGLHFFGHFQALMSVGDGQGAVAHLLNDARHQSGFGRAIVCDEDCGHVRCVCWFGCLGENLREELADALRKLVRIEWFANVVGSSLLHSPKFVALAALAGDENDGDFRSRFAFLDLATGDEAVLLGHDDVEQHKTRHVLNGEFDGDFAILGRNH